MKFIHIADIHLGAEPEGLKLGSENRAREIWEALEQVVNLCEWEEMDLLLIAGDLFHRQPLLRELKELNYMFSRLTKTKVIFVVGNHDYLKPDSYYHTFVWNENVFPILNGHMGCVELDSLQTAVYGVSYHQREITERLFDYMSAQKRQPYEILLAHGGDEKHIPVKKDVLESLGYTYIAMGHIHRPGIIIPDKAIYAGALEPIDQNDIGPHGYIKGEITQEGVRTEFIPAAKRSYIHITLKVEKDMTSGGLKDLIRSKIQENGLENIYKFVLKGYRDLDMEFELESARAFGNIVAIVDETKPALNMLKLKERNQENLLGRYIESLEGYEEGSMEYEALCEGVKALLETKRG